MNFCTRCHGQRFKSAPLPLVGGVLGVVTGRRRYRCADCGRPTWHRRLRRHTSDVGSASTRRDRPSASWVVLIATLLILLSGMFALRGCEPRSQQDVPDTGRARAVRDWLT